MSSDPVSVRGDAAHLDRMHRRSPLADLPIHRLGVDDLDEDTPQRPDAAAVLEADGGERP